MLRGTHGCRIDVHRGSCEASGSTCSRVCLADNGHQHDIDTNNRFRQKGILTIAAILRGRLSHYLSGRSFLADFHPTMKKPYDMEADDPWLASGYDPTTLPDSKLQRPYKRGDEEERMTPQQLTLLWTMLPEWVHTCKSTTDKKKLTAWKDKATNTALKHTVFGNSSESYKVSAILDIESFQRLMYVLQKVLKWFTNKKTQNIDTGKGLKNLPVFDDDGADDDAVEEEVAADAKEGGGGRRDDNVVGRRGLLRFSTNLNGQLLFQEKNRKDVQQRALELKDEVKGGNNGAAFSKASFELWGELPDAEREKWEEEAAKVNTRDRYVFSISSNFAPRSLAFQSTLLRLPLAVQLLSDKLTKEIKAIAGPAAVSVMYLFRDRETGHVDGSVYVNSISSTGISGLCGQRADSSACGSEVAVMSESLGSNLFATLTEWFEAKCPREPATQWTTVFDVLTGPI